MVWPTSDAAKANPYDRNSIMRQLTKARYPLIVVLAALAVGLLVRVYSTERSNAHAAIVSLLPTSQELAVALYRVGLDPDALAAAGVSPGAASGVVSNAIEHLVDNPMTLELADAAWASSRQQCAQLRRQIRAGLATPEQRNTYPAAKIELAQLTAQRRQTLNALFETATADLGNSRRHALTAIRGNRKWSLPIEFLLAERSDAQWVRLRNCLADERVAAKLDRPPDPEAHAALAEMRSHAAVATAKANLDANRDVVTTAWNQAVGD